MVLASLLASQLGCPTDRSASSLAPPPGARPFGSELARQGPDRVGLSDAWSTALLVVGARGDPRTALARPEALGLQAQGFDADGAAWTTPGWPSSYPSPSRNDDRPR